MARVGNAEKYPKDVRDFFFNVVFLSFLKRLVAVFACRPKIPANIEQLFTPSETRPNYIFQTFLYAAIMSRQQSLMVAPALLYIHRAASENYSPVIEMGEPRKPKIPVNNFAFFEDDFRERLQTLLEEIFSEEEPFTQTEDTKKCSYCDFKAICKR